MKNDPQTISLTCKDMRIMFLTFSANEKFIETLLNVTVRYCFPQKIEELFAFGYSPKVFLFFPK